MRRHFYDVGANVGQTFDNYLLPGAFRKHEVFCFEPSPRHLTALRAKAEAVCPQFRGVAIVPAAVGLAPGFARLYEKRTLLSDSLAFGWRENIRTDVSVVVPVIRLSDFILEHSPEAAVDLKVDTEGAEYGILTDLLQNLLALKRIASLQVEWHEVDGQGREQREALTARFATHGIEVQRWPF